MSRKAWGLAALAGGLGCAGVVVTLAVLILVIRNPLSAQSSVSPMERSPSGRYWLEIVEGECPECGRFRQFQIADSSPHPKVVFQSPDHFRTRDRLSFTWDNEERVWVYSGDLGTYYWEQDREGQWIKHGNGSHGLIPPANLRGSGHSAQGE